MHQLVGRGGDLLGIADNRRDHLAQGLLHAADIGQQAVVVARGAIDFGGQVASGDALGDGRGNGRIAAQRVDDVAGDEHQRNGNEADNAQAPDQ